MEDTTRIQLVPSDVSSPKAYCGLCPSKSQKGTAEEVMNWLKVHYQKIHGIDINTKEVTDNVNHPKHYTSHPSGIECIEVTRHMNFNLGNVVKYIWRAGLKDQQPSLQELKKAQWYLSDEIKRIENEEVSLRGQAPSDSGRG